MTTQRIILGLCELAAGGPPRDRQRAIVFWTLLHRRACDVIASAAVELHILGQDPDPDWTGPDATTLPALIRELATRGSVLGKLGPAGRAVQLRLVLAYAEWVQSMAVVGAER